jgi:ATPase family protein associated with various cellular activities (AAA)
MTPFADVPRTPRGHLGLHFYRAAHAVALHVRARAIASGQNEAAVLHDFPFLADYVAELVGRFPSIDPWTPDDAWLQDAIVQWETETETWLPLRALVSEGLDSLALLTLALIGLIEEDSGFATIFASLQAVSPSRRPTVGLLRQILASATGDPGADAWTHCAPLLRCGVARVLNHESPRAEWALAVPPAIWTVLRGEPPAEPASGLRHIRPQALERTEELIVPDTLVARLHEVAGVLATRQATRLVIRGLPGTDRLGVVGALARTGELPRGLLVVTSGAGTDVQRLVGPLSTLLPALPVFDPDLGPAETFALPALDGYSGPSAVLLGREGGLAPGGTTLTIELAPDAPAERRRHWQRALGHRAGAATPEIADRFALSGGYIRECARHACASANLEGRSEVTLADVREATRAMNRQQLDTLAQRLDGGGDWSQLVVGAATERDLRDLEERCRQRERLAGALGAAFPGGLNRGVRALFEGPSGSGKTLAARILAGPGALGIDLYRVDLAAVVNKYIGETEKNLSRVLSRAEDLDVILLLDEGDALLGRRTDVRTANDRYANLETNYLLQRLETYQGIVIVTTNLGAQIDPGFRRRMDVVVKFSAPDAEARWLLWQLHLPPQHVVDDDALQRFAARYQLTGGQIRNAAIYANLQAVHRVDQLNPDDILAGIQSEFRKAGAAFPAAALRPLDGREQAMTTFLATTS